jgi:hypothetical protein
MSYQEKSSILSLICFPFFYGAYWIFTLQKIKTGTPGLVDDLSFWAIQILIFVGLSVAGRIILEILFNIASAIATRREEVSMMEDERDRLFELQSTRVSAYIVGFGFLLSLSTLALKWPPYIMVNVLYFAFIGSTLAAEITKLRYYRKGM